MNILEVENLNVHYGDFHVLRDVSLSMESGEVVALLGRNGVGKTTLVKTILRVIKPTSGIIKIRGKDTTNMWPHQIRELGVAVVPQGGRVFPNLTVLKNLEIGIQRKIQWEDIERVADLFPFLKERLEQKAGTLSGGERQMVSIARALISDPQLILMDEPMIGLMPKMVEKLKEIIKQLSREGAGLLIIEQKVMDALEISDRVYIMDAGAIKYSGPAQKLLENKDELLKYLGAIPKS